MPLDSVFVLESSGGPPEDTLVRIPPNQARVVVMRRGAPDNSLFALLDFPAGTLTARSGAATVELTLKPRPGLYGVDLDTGGGAIRPGATLTFSYAVHFVAPAGARRRYGSDLAFERELLVARVGADGRVTFLPTTRPGSDMVTARLAAPGRYVVAAPK